LPAGAAAKARFAAGRSAANSLTSGCQKSIRCPQIDDVDGARDPRRRHGQRDVAPILAVDCAMAARGQRHARPAASSVFSAAS